jgi:hypothetical protein
MTYALAALLVVHGLIHLLGFSKAFGLADLPQLVLPISRALGVAWLVAGLALMAAAITLLWSPRWWWAPAALGVLLSQAVIVSSWGDAKFGIVANVLILVALGLTAFEGAFHARFEAQSAAAVAACGTHGSAPVTEHDLRGLPEPMARWIRWSGAVGKKRIDVLRMRHGGLFKAGPSRGWMPIRGEYVITTRTPSFHWYGRMQMLPGVHAAAIDAYQQGHGHMQVKALSAITVVDDGSSQTDQSAFGRCVAELSMTPSFFLDRQTVRCEAIGANHARCEVREHGFTAAADIHVHDDGSLDRIEVMRAFDRGQGRYTMERFTGKASKPATWGGRRLASHFDGYWNLPEGDLHYVSFDVEHAAFE